MILRSSNIHNNQIVLKDTVHVSPEIVNTSNVNVNDIIVVVRNGSRKLIGKHARVLKAMPNTVIGAFMTGIRSQNGKFVNALFDGDIFQREIYKNLGATINQITIKSFKEMEFYIPQNHEKQIIGNLISQIDNLLALQQRKLEQLELLQKSILQTIFTSNNKKEKIELNKLANYRRGSFPQPYTNKKWYGGKNSKPFVQVIDVNDNLKLHEQTKERISEIAQPKSVFVPKGSIIVTLQGSIGRVAITQYDSYVDRTLLILTDFKKKIDKYYFANALKMVFNKEKLKAPGGTIKTITKSTLSSFKIVLPNIKLQIQYGKLLKSVDKQFILNKNRIMKLKKIKQFLLQNIFI